MKLRGIQMALRNVLSNKTVRLVILVVLALTLTGLCLARSRPVNVHKNPLHVCVPRCDSYCSAMGMLAYQTCTSCYCYAPPSGCEGGCGGSGYGGCGYGGGYGGCGYGGG